MVPCVKGRIPRRSVSSRSLLIYAERARLIEDDTVASGRRPLDRALMPLIRADVLMRLALGPSDTLLDIGSGFGMLTVPLSYFVDQVTAVDHADVLARMPERPNIRKMPGDFLDLDFGPARYSRILAYSMLHYVGDRERVLAIIDKAVQLLAHDGLLLLGDVPNDDYRGRTAATLAGQRRVLDIGIRLVALEPERKQLESVLMEAPDPPAAEFTDGFLLAIVSRVRKAGHNAWIMRQSPSLPFSHAREDILIQKLEPGPVRDLFIVTTTGDPQFMALSMREVQPYDCDLIYRWSQDPMVRAASIRTETFTIEEHRRWFAVKMDERVNGDVRWYMLEEAARIPLGHVRYDHVRIGRPLWSGGPRADRDGGTELALIIAPSARGSGLGALALLRSEPHAREKMPAPLVALIRSENAASLKTFERAGYVRVGDEERMGVKLERWEKT